jgi:hypothetical protein
MSLMLDHVVILVDDLDQAVVDYQSQGFVVTPGGTHADGLTHNALIVLADRSYLELIAFVEPHDVRDNVWGWRSYVSKGGGLIDYCIATDDITAATKAFRAQGLAVTEPTIGGRVKPDRTEIQWRSARFWQTGRELPFLIEDVTARELRVPQPNSHPNGVSGIHDLLIAVADLPRVASLLSLMMGTPVPSFGNNRRYDASTASFRLGKHTITLAAPNSRLSPIQRRIETISLGPCALTWTTTGDDPPKGIAPIQTWFGPN